MQKLSGFDTLDFLGPAINLLHLNKSNDTFKALIHLLNCGGKMVKQRDAYSVLKLFTGLETATLMAWKEMVANAITSASKPANANIHQLMFIRYAKSSSHC